MNRQTAAKRHTHQFLACFVLISLGVFMRFSGLDFDQGHHLQPDERFLVMVVNGIQLPSSLKEYLDTSRSPLNPVNRGYDFYVYGDLPISLAKAVAVVTGTDSYDKFLVTGRLIAALADTSVIVLVFLLALEAFGYIPGLMAAALYAISVLPIQLSHFFAVDPFLNLFATATLLFLLYLYKRPRVKNALFAGLFWGLALSSKLSAIFLAPVVALWALIFFVKDKKRGSACLYSILIFLMAFFACRIFNPYAFSSSFFFDPALSEDFLGTISRLNALSQPLSGFPPSLQWAHRNPLLFPLKNMALWGMGLCLFGAGLSGMLFFLARILKGKDLYLFIPLASAVSLFCMMGAYPAQTMRYFLPAYPVFALMAAGLLWKLMERKGKGLVPCWPFFTVAFFTLCWALAFHSIFQAPNTRVAASSWMAANVPDGSVICTELWDDSLPLGGMGRDRFRFRQVDMVAQKGDGKVEKILRAVGECTYYVVSSNRIYGSTTRLRYMFPAASRFYEMLFGGVAGFSLEKEFVSYPHLGPIVFPDDEAEEAFTVYDHPRVMVFKKTPSFSSRDLKKALIESLSEANGIMEDASVPIIPITGTFLRAREGQEVPFLLRFAALITLSGLCGALIGSYLFPGSLFPARGLVLLIGAFAYGLALTVVPYLGQAIPLIFLFLVALLALLFIWRQDQLPAGRKDPSVVFWLVFSFFLICRCHNPAIFWGERPMDFAILNAMMRSSIYPPIDPWFSGDILRYHGWGQFFVAFMGKVSGIPPAYLYNLGTALVPALVAELFYWTVLSMKQGRAAALLAAGLMVFGGNLSALWYWPWKGGSSFDDFWKASRIIPGTINEFPLWSALFGDLHGHFIGMVFSAIFIAMLILWLDKRHGLWPLILAGASLAALALSNPWSIPFYALVLLLVAMTQDGKGMTLVVFSVSLTALFISLPLWHLPIQKASLMLSDNRTSGAEIFIIFGGFFLIYLSWLFTRLRWSKGPWAVFLVLSSLALYLFPCGATLSAVLLVPTLAYLWKEDMGKKGVLFSLFMVSGLVTIIGCDFFVLSDRMNTIFKFYYETWLVFSLGASIGAALLSIRQIRSGPGVCCALAMAGMFFTSLFTFVSWWQNPMMESGRFTLNGLHYLLEKRPSEMMMVAFLQRVPGQPVIAEAFGPSYGPYARISSFTGLPAVIGWEYHVFQHGHAMEEIKKREGDIRQLYETEDPDTLRLIIRKYGIKYVILGSLERKAYGTAIGKPFKEAGLRLVMRSGKEEIWTSEEI